MSDWSNLAEDARARVGQPGPRCGVEAFLRYLGDDERKKVEPVLNLPGLTARGIRKAIWARVGETAPSEWSIANHRRGGCRCSR